VPQDKFQEANDQTFKQASIPIKQAFNQSRKQTIQSSILNAYGEFLCRVLENILKCFGGK
jgi:pyrrolidone-carboxylate peptidase